jgi:hypothetical protein
MWGVVGATGMNEAPQARRCGGHSTQTKGASERTLPRKWRNPNPAATVATAAERLHHPDAARGFLGLNWSARLKMVSRHEAGLIGGDVERVVRTGRTT